MPQLDRETHNEIVDLLIPYVDTLDKRSALIDSAFYDFPRLKARIDRDGAPQVFSANLVAECDRFPNEDGQPMVLFALLDYAEEYLVVSKQTIDRLKSDVLADYARPPQLDNNETETVKSPNVGIVIGGIGFIIASMVVLGVLLLFAPFNDDDLTDKTYTELLQIANVVVYVSDPDYDEWIKVYTEIVIRPEVTARDYYILGVGYVNIAEEQRRQGKAFSQAARQAANNFRLSLDHGAVFDGGIYASVYYGNALAREMLDDLMAAEENVGEAIDYGYQPLPFAYALTARIQRKSGDLQQAQANIEIALEGVNESLESKGDIFIEAGNIYFCANEMGLAEDYYQDYLSTNPDRFPANNHVWDILAFLSDTVAPSLDNVPEPFFTCTP